MKTLIAALTLALLAGCATGPRYDTTYNSVGQSSRVRFLVLHYTVADKPSSIKILTEQQVSAHYLLTDDPEPVIYRLVDETRSAYHAGNSSWKNYTQLNNSSIGIEIVNAGWKDTPNGRVFAPFPQTQVDALVGLVKDIVQRHGVAPENVLGHSDIAPLRKQDPGPLFPWQRLAQEGLVKWPDAARVALVRPAFDAFLPDAGWFQRKLVMHGFSLPQTGVLDEATRTTLAAFQMKYRPADYAGNPDAETATLLEVLTTPPNAPLPVFPVPTAPVPPVPPTPAVPPVPPSPAPLTAPSVPAPPVPVAPTPVVPETAPAPAAPPPPPVPAPTGPSPVTTP
ncbi:N-acetylmuramoyl-L-alanine amidase [Massilia sp. AB1]|nr:N-acetylmuramoyl-L-alanine amidase [Massilia sp. AB1]